MRLIYILLILFSIDSAIAQQIYFHKTYSTDNSLGIGVIAIDSGNFLMSCNYNPDTASSDPGGATIYKLNAYGNVLDSVNMPNIPGATYHWPPRLYKGYYGDYFNCDLLADTLEPYFTLTKQNRNSDTIFSIDIKSDINPDSLNDTPYRFTAPDYAKATNDGGILIMSRVNGVYHSNRKVLKIDSLGSIQWVYNMGDDSATSLPSYYGISVDIMPDSSVLCTFSTSEGYISGANHIIIKKLDKNGNEIRSRTIGYSEQNLDPFIKYNPNDGYVYLAYSKEFASNENEYPYDNFLKPHLIKMDQNLNLIWEKAYGKTALVYPNNDHIWPRYGINDFLIEDNGEMTIFGNVADKISVSNKHNYLKFLLRFDTNGDSLWFKAYDFIDITGSVATNYAYGGICQNEDNGYTIVTNIWTNNISKALVFRVDSNGCPNEYCSYADIQESFKSETNISLYPNPAVDNITLKFANGINDDLFLYIYNSLGQEVLREYIPRLTIQKSINLHELLSGVYFYKLDNGTKQLKTGKLVVE